MFQAMKKVFSILMVAFAMTAMIACNKDNVEDGDDNGNNNTPTEAAVNTAVIDGRTYHLNCRYAVEQSGRGYLDAESVEQQDSVSMLTVRGDVRELNRTYDLTHYIEDADYAFGVMESNGENSCTFQQDNHVDGEPHYYGTINEQEYSDGAFSSGTLIVNCADSLLTYKVTGMLKNGKAVSFHISVPASEWVHLNF